MSSSGGSSALDLQSTSSLGDVRKALANAPSPSATAEELMRYRLIFLATQMRGEMVSVKTVAGTEVEGVFHSVEFEHEAILLKMAQPKNHRKRDIVQGLRPKMVLKMTDVVFIQVIGSKFQKRAQQNFKTDTQISGAWRGRNRKLQMWKPDKGDEETTLEFGSLSKNWDQFAANEKLTGKKGSSFDINEYSSTLDKNSKFYRENEAEAARLAAEIESKSKSSSRRFPLRAGKSDDDDDEEALHSKVLSNDDEATKHKGGPASSAGAGNNAPSRPAIFSSSTASTSKPGGKEGKKGQVETTKVDSSKTSKEDKEEKKTTKSKLNPKAKAFVPKFARMRTAPLQMQQQQQPPRMVTRHSYPRSNNRHQARPPALHPHSASASAYILQQQQQQQMQQKPTSSPYQVINAGGVPMQYVINTAAVQGGARAGAMGMQQQQQQQGTVPYPVTPAPGAGGRPNTAAINMVAIQQQAAAAAAARGMAPPMQVVNPQSHQQQHVAMMQTPNGLLPAQHGHAMQRPGTYQLRQQQHHHQQQQPYLTGAQNSNGSGGYGRSM